MSKASEVLVYTVTHGDRPYLPRLVPQFRGAFGLWCDWLICGGNLSAEALDSAIQLLRQPDGLGLQHLIVWPENRGQHHAMVEALRLARSEGYKWLLRLDDDVQPKTKGFLKKMIERLEELKRLAGDDRYRLVAAPKVIGLKHPLQPSGSLSKGQRYMVDVMEVLGGACRLHPVELLDKYEPPIYDPVGRGDPEALAEYLQTVAGVLVRFPDLRVVHQTSTLELQDSPSAAQTRTMGRFWPYLGETV